MALATTTRFLVAGDTGGDLARLFARVGAVNAKHGPFAFLLCVGDFLGAADASAAALAPYLSGDAAVPLPTYVLASRPGEPDPALEAAGPGGELAPQLFYLGSAGVAELSGLRVAYLSGGGGGCSVDPAAVGELRAAAGGAGFGGVDVLLTCAWPRGFYLKLDPSSLPADLLPDKDLPEVGLEEVAELAVKLRPRYHFCGGEGAFWQRPPYRLDARSHACRMVGLSRVEEDKKQTWLKAFGMVPQAALGGAVPAQPEGTTDCPYPYAALAAGGGGGGGERRGERAAKRQREEWVKDGRGWIAEQCWFCTSSTQFESHLVTSVGDETYLTIAKGPLVPHHSLLVPVAHKASSLDLSAAEAAELRSYVSAVRRCFAARGEALLTFERYLGGSSNRAQFEHMHLQLVPLPHDAANGAREAFEREGASRGVRFELLAAGTRLSDVLPTAEPFFAVELPSGETLLHKLATNQRRHPLQFGREVIAQLIGKPERSDWKRCLPQEQPGGPPLGELERELASSFQEAFAPFAPTFD